MGLGVSDPKGCFGTTTNLHESFPGRVFETPVSENTLTGVCLGSAITGLRPILVHLRIDFTMYAMDQMINNMAKWRSMFGGQVNVPMVVRMVIGMGWGQGNQHSQNLQSFFAHVPGIKVIVPATAYDMKGMLISAMKDNNPVIILEHRWLQFTKSIVPEEMYEVPIGKCNVLTEGSDITIVSWGQVLIETLKANEFLKENGVSAEIIDLRSLTPLDMPAIKRSVQKTGKLLVVDSSWKTGGFAGEIIARVCEDPDIMLDTMTQRLCYPDFPVPSSPGHANHYYIRSTHIFDKVSNMLEKELDKSGVLAQEEGRLLDAPDQNFIGPF